MVGSKWCGRPPNSKSSNRISSADSPACHDLDDFQTIAVSQRVSGELRWRDGFPVEFDYDTPRQELLPFKELPERARKS